ncbi:TIGR02285 family protein [Pseudomonas sp. Rh2]|uniref:TIGR02285 family protein n=1 Tax=Pseudomonas sp. Rh2 TaxID=3112956 RepID=UPI00345DECD1
MPAPGLLRRLTGLLGLLATLATGPALAKERVLWLVRDLPPFTIFEGTEKGQGVIDQLLPLLISQMPEYEHDIVRVNRARGIQMLQDPRSLTCDPTLLWTPEREKFVHFSIPSLGVLSGGLLVRKQDRDVVEPFLDDQQVDLKRLLTDTRLKLGIVAERSYSAQIDAILRQLPDEAFSRHYGNDATASLLQMQQKGRLKLMLGYRHEVNYLTGQQGGSADDYLFYPILGVNRFQFLHVGCSDTPMGRQLVEHIDQLLPALRQDTLPLYYSHWLDPEQRESYLEQSRHFFHTP